MDAPDLLRLIATLTLLLTGLVLPGAALARALRLPVTVATAFSGSVLAIYTSLLALQFAGIAVTLATLSLVLAVITFAGAAAGRVVRGNDPHPADTHGQVARYPFAPFASMGGWTPLYLLAWAALILRAGQNPLAGPDIEFRWGFLAEQWLRQGSLAFYPPRSAADFTSYFWAESIPPGVAALHLWAFACAGQSAAAWTIPALLLQVLTLHELIWRTAERLAGIRAAQLATLAAAACPLLSWSALLGQETGLTAIALTGLAWALTGWRENGERRWLAAAGLFASVGAVTREYGLVFPVLAAAGVSGLRPDRRAWLAFLLPVTVGLVWPARTWLLTGNPFHSLAVGRLFPVNERFVAWTTFDAAPLGAELRSPEGLLTLGRYFLFFAAPAVLGWLGVAVQLRTHPRLAGWGLGSIGAIIVLWVVSVPYTNGGLFYSMRVLSPALALGCLAAGIGAAHLTAPPRRSGLVPAGAMTVLTLGMLIPTLALPLDFRRNPWREWPAFHRATLGTKDETVAAVERLRSASGPANRVGVILADGPGFQRRFAQTGLNVIPLWSPQADGLFNLTLAPAEAARRWQASGITHVVITKWQTNLDFFLQHSRCLRSPFVTRVAAETAQTRIYSVTITD